MDVITIIANWLELSWSLVNGVQVPGLNFTFGDVIIGTIVITSSLKVLNILFGISSSGGNNKRIKINKQREGDEH